MTIALWIVQILLALVFLASGFRELLGALQEFTVK
jgi:uncharacterized membrane protein YphA (DoxX/SURF4 family)